MKSGRKKLWIFAAVLFLLVLATLGAVVWYCTAEAAAEAKLPPEERIKRNFDNAFDPTQSTLGRLDQLRRSFRNAQQVPAERRNAVIIDAIAGSIDRLLQDFAALPPEEKPERARLLREDAEKTLAYFRRLPREQQQKALALLMSSEGGARLLRPRGQHRDQPPLAAGPGTAWPHL